MATTTGATREVPLIDLVESVTFDSDVLLSIDRLPDGLWLVADSATCGERREYRLIKDAAGHAVVVMPVLEVLP